MTVQTVARPEAPVERRPVGSRGPARSRAGQVVAAQVAVALVAAAIGRGAAVLAGALAAATLLLCGAWLRVRGRWLHEWLAVAAGHLTRRRVLPPASGPEALLGLVAPDTAVDTADVAGTPRAVLSDPGGLTTVFELAAPGGLLGDGPAELPSPAALLPAAGPEHPPVRIQLLLAGSPAPVTAAGGGAAATSYRQLTEGRVPGHERALLAVRVLRADGRGDEELRPALSGAVRKVVRRLGPVVAQPLGEAALLRVLGELAHHDGDRAVAESWQGVRAGGPAQTSFRLLRWPDVRVDGGRRLLPRLLALPATATAVSLSADPGGAGTGGASAGLTVRVAADGPAELARATQALLRLAEEAGAEVRRLDGEQLPGLAATLPLAPAVAAPAPPPGTVDALELPIGAAGLMIGANRHGAPVTLRLFRPEATRLLLVGGVRAAQLVALRAMALGARVVVQTPRPRTWEPFVRGVGGPAGTVPVVPPGRTVTGAPGTPTRPLLLVCDGGPAPADTSPEAGWRATLVLRDELTAADADALARADLAVLQPLDAAEAALAGTALGLGGSADWLTRIREDMVAVVNRRALRWALLSPTPLEAQLIGRPTRR